MNTQHDGIAVPAGHSAAGTVSTSNIVRRKTMLRSVSIESPRIVPDATESLSSNPTLIAVGREFDLAHAKYWSACREFRRKYDEWKKMWDSLWPDEIKMRDSDWALFKAAEIRIDPTFQKLGKPVDLTYLDELNDKANLKQMTPHMRRRRHELLAARLQWERNNRASERKVGYSSDVEERVLRGMVTTLDRLARRAISLRDSSQAGIQIKARMALWLSEQQHAGQQMQQTDLYSGKMLWSLVRDILESAGQPIALDSRKFGAPHRLGKCAV